MVKVERWKFFTRLSEFSGGKMPHRQFLLLRQNGY